MAPAQAKTIVIADDYPQFRSFLRKQLNGNGFRIVAEASNGREAVEKVAELQPDLVLLDITMPYLNGITAAAQIRSVAPETKILFVSQNADPDIIGTALSDGASGYVYKPKINSELLPAIEAVLNGKRFVSILPRT